MENQESKEKMEEYPVEPDFVDTQADRTILEEIKLMNQQMADPSYQSFKKTTYWHQQSSNVENSNVEALLKDMTEKLVEIEAKLSKIELLLMPKA